MRHALLSIIVFTAISMLTACSGGDRDAPFQLGKSTTDPLLAAPPARLFERAR